MPIARRRRAFRSIASCCIQLAALRWSKRGPATRWGRHSAKWRRIWPRRASTGEHVLIWGDIVHMPDIQTRRPDVWMEPDVDGEAAIATRKRIFEQVATDRLLAAGMHMHFPGFLNLDRRSDGGYELIPEIWKQAL